MYFSHKYFYGLFIEWYGCYLFRSRKFYKTQLNYKKAFYKSIFYHCKWCSLQRISYNIFVVDEVHNLCKNDKISWSCAKSYWNYHCRTSDIYHFICFVYNSIYDNHLSHVSKFLSWKIFFLLHNFLNIILCNFWKFLILIIHIINVVFRIYYFSYFWGIYCYYIAKSINCHYFQCLYWDY